MNTFCKFTKIYLRILSYIDSIKYARLMGVKFTEGELHIYGRVRFGTEPWLIRLGTNVHLTDGIKFITHDGGTLIYRRLVPDLEITKPISLGDDVYVGNNVLILPGVTIGNNVIIGSGAIVSNDIPDNSVAVGVPARVIKTADDYFKKIQKESLHLGHLKGREKDEALKKYYSNLWN
jgi:acetyltransferase-like isoleucine patch superfamily enzyme